MIERFSNQEAEYARFIGRGSRFVYNDFGGGYGRLHHSDCGVLNRGGPASYGLHTSVPKVCGDDSAELMAHLRSRDREGPIGCAFCFPDGLV